MPNERAQFQQDRHRPLYHFLPPACWMNDPNGLIQWQGQVHLFYQHNPHSAQWGTIHWGHAVSRNLVHWQDLPLALAPSPGGPDKDGCWSGCAIEHEGECVLFYTGDSPQVQCMAASRDMITWHKSAQNPVIAAPPPALDVVGNPWDLRDPWVWRAENLWNMLLGSGLKDQGGTVLLYQSTDLIHWTFVQPILTGRLAPDGTVWECPNLFSLNERDVLLISEQPESRHTYYLVGDYVDHQFKPVVQGKTDYGPYFYAALTFLDNRQRRLMWGWLKEGRTPTAQQNAGWSGVMSLPRVLTVGADGRLGMVPAPELEMLRHNPIQSENLTLTPGGGQPLAGMKGDCLEILLEGQAAENTRFEILLRCSPDQAEYTSVQYDTAQQTLVVDSTRASLDPETISERLVAPLQADPNNRISLRIFLDRSVVEIFAGDDTCITSRIYPAREDSLGLSLSVHQGTLNIQKLAVYEIVTIWQ